MNDNEALIHSFYTSFQKRDAEGMVACYHPEVRFYDPVFQELRGPKAGAMWKMLCAQATDLSVDFKDISADESSGRAHWDASYTFSATGRKVLNKIDAAFVLRDGKIVDHKDSFDLKAWFRMAFGFSGIFFGSLGFLENRFRSTAQGRLASYMRKHNIG